MSSVLEIVVLGEDRASGVLRGIGGALSSFGDSARRVGMDLLPISAGAALVAGGAIKMAADYERSMDVLQASTGASTLEMQALDKMAVALGGDMTLPATSAKDAAEAMLELSKAGLSVTDTMAAARGVLQLSAAAQISNSEAALITANALNMFKLSGDKATEVADLLAAGANKSSANIGQMADALQMSGNVAASAGLTIGDLTTAIALMANQGIAGSDAGTSIKTMLLSLQAPTGIAAGLMKELGISIYDSNGKMLPMPGLIAEFSGALGGLSQQQQNAALKTIFGSDAIRAANVLLLGGTQAWNDMSTAVNAGGTAAEMAAAQNRGLAGALDGLRSIVETVLLTAARPLLDTLSGIVRWVGDLIGKFAEANPQLMTAGLAFAGVLAVAAPLALGIGMIATVMGTLLAPVGLVVLAIGGLAAAWASNTGNIQGYVNTLIKVFQVWYEKTGSVVGGIMGALGALGLMVPTLQPVIDVIKTVVTWVQQTLPLALLTLQSMWQSAWSVIRETFMSVVAGIAPIVTQLITWFGESLPTTLRWLSTLWSEVWATIQSVIDAILPIILDFVQGVVTAFTSSWPQILNIVSTVFNTILSTIQTVIAIIGPAIATFVQNAVDVFQNVWPQILTVVSGVLQSVQMVIATVLGAVQTFMASHGEEIKTFIGGAWQAVQGIIETVLAIIQATIIPALQAIADFIRTHGDDIQAILSAAWAAISGSISAVLTVIQGILKAALQVIQGDWSGAWETLKETGARLWTIINTTITTIAAALAPLLAAIWAGIKTAAAAAWEAMKVAAAMAWENIKAAAVQKWNDIKTAIAQKLADMLKAVVQWLDDTLAKIEGFTLLDAAKFLFGTLLPGIVMRLSEALTSVAKWLKDVFDKISKHDLKPATQTSFGTVVAGIAAKVPDILKNVISFLDKAAEKIKGYTFKSQTMTAIQTVIAGILSRVADILQSVLDFLNAIRNTIQNFSLFDAGAALIKGMIDGVKSMAGALVDAARGVVQGAIDAAKSLLGIQSPSTVFAEIGRQVLEGLILGIDEKQAEAAQKVAEAVAAICEAAVKAADALRDFQPVNNMGVITAQIMEFLLGVETEFSALTQRVNQELATQAKEFADALAPVISVIGTGLDVLGALPKYVTRLSWQEIDASLDFVAWAIGVMAGQVATCGSRISDDLQAAARTFAENVGPVVDLIGGALDVLGALPKYVTRLSWQEVVAALETVAWAIGVMAGQVAIWGLRIEEDMQVAARKFAENVGPVIDVIVGGLEALAALRDFVALDPAAREAIIANMQNLNRFLASLVSDLAKVAGVVKDDLQTAANQFAENVGPALDLITDGMEAITALREFAGLDSEALEVVIGNMQMLNRFMASLVADLAKVSLVVKSDLQAAAREFAENAKVALESVKDAFETLANLGEMEAPAVGLAWVAGLEASMTARVPSLEAVLSRILLTFERTLIDIQRGAYGAGLGFMNSLADGLTAGLLSVEAALAAVAALFPHSPAKAGPLRVAPNWAAWMMGGLDDAAGLVSSGLAWQMPRGLIPGSMGQSGGTTANNTTVNINGPTIRDEMDIRRLADAVSAVLTGQQSTNRRLGATW